MAAIDVEKEALWFTRYRGIEPARALNLALDLLRTWDFTRVRIRDEETGLTVNILVAYEHYLQTHGWTHGEGKARVNRSEA